jgi:hypothetical protein
LRPQGSNFLIEFLVLRLEDVLVVLYFKQFVFGGLYKLGLVGDRFFQAINHSLDIRVVTRPLLSMELVIEVIERAARE